MMIGCQQRCRKKPLNFIQTNMKNNCKKRFQFLTWPHGSGRGSQMFYQENEDTIVITVSLGLKTLNYLIRCVYALIYSDYEFSNFI